MSERSMTVAMSIEEGGTKPHKAFFALSHEAKMQWGKNVLIAAVVFIALSAALVIAHYEKRETEMATPCCRIILVTPTNASRAETENGGEDGVATELYEERVMDIGTQQNSSKE